MWVQESLLQGEEITKYWNNYIFKHTRYFNLCLWVFTQCWRSEDSKSAVMQVQVSTGLIEALLTMIIVRQNCSLSSDCRDPTYILFQKIQGEKECKENQ